MIPLIDAKICNKCKILKFVKDFPPNKQCALGVTGTCRQCYNKNTAQWYQDNRLRRQQAMNERNRKRKALVVQHFGDRCEDCQQTYQQCVYEFHHLDPTQKDWNPSKSMSHSLERMWEELGKCIMLCANCHRVRHFGTDRKEGDM